MTTEKIVVSFRNKGNQTPFMMIIREFYDDEGDVVFASVIAEAEDITDLKPEYRFPAIESPQTAP